LQWASNIIELNQSQPKWANSSSNERQSAAHQASGMRMILTCLPMSLLSAASSKPSVTGRGVVDVDAGLSDIMKIAKEPEDFDAGEISEERATDYGVRGVSFIVKPSRQQLTTIQELIDHGVIRPVVSAVFPLARAREAFERGLAGHMRGKLVLSVQPRQKQAQQRERVST
jgi:D-arabinose 1-dehydrogenase-like Zn-dependent alcohol dehydrogenase